MKETDDYIYEDDYDYDFEQVQEQRRLRRQKRKRKAAIQRAIFFILLAIVLVVGSVVALKVFMDRSSTTNPNNNEGSGNPVQIQTEPLEHSTESVQAVTEAITTEATAETEQSEPVSAEPLSADAASVLEQAKRMAAGYDYDGAIALIKSIPGYESDSSFSDAITEFEATKASCVAVDVNTVPHIFYHSLINDTNRAFNVSVLGQGAVDGMNAWMTTIEEFDQITQSMYDNGYVFVRLRDLVVETVDASGNVTFTPNTSLLLPPGKKPVVLSVDDLSYYHSYEAAGYPDKLVLDENGKVKCHYVTADGTEQIGDFDVVPRLNTFLEEHPDGSYKGARGLIALTGYNGVFGYRTDYDYEAKANLMSDQAAWLNAHPEFNRQEDIEQATIVANAIKESGWEFASHTWGHLSVTGKTAEQLQTDNEKWINNVQNIVGPVDTIIFAHGNDIGSWEGYSSDNPQYAYYKGAGYNFFCNVDSSVPYWVQITSNYVRQGRIDLDGYLLYQASQGNTTVLDNMFTASQIFDSRRPTPVVANGES